MKTVWLFVLMVCLGCDETIDVDNSPAQVTAVGGITSVGSPPTAVDVEYTLRDLEGDDTDVLVQICDESDVCGAAWQSAGGDGTARVTTVPFDTDVPHIFRWNPSCGRVVGSSVQASGLDDSLRFRIQVAESTSSLESVPFTLRELGFAALADCTEAL
ncbi:MAG: hypothetical protein R3E66_10785 [bacterium]